MLSLALVLRVSDILNFSAPAPLKTKFKPEKRNQDLYVQLELGAEDEWVQGLSGRERQLIADMVEAGNSRDWFSVQRAFKSSSQEAAPQFNFAMAAAFKCGQFKEGMKIFDKLSAASVNKTLKSYCCALRLSGELGSQGRVLDLWAEAQQDNLWQDNESACSLMCAALFASSKLGNVTFAASLLDMMQKRGKVLNVIDWNQGIDACTAAGEAGAARYLFDQMTEAGVQPNIITLTLLAGAHNGRSLKRICDVERLLNDFELRPDLAFFEELVCATFGARELKMTTIMRAQDAEAVVLNAPMSHRHEAWQLIQQARSQGLVLSNLLRLFEEALRRVGGI